MSGVGGARLESRTVDVRTLRAAALARSSLPAPQGVPGRVGAARCAVANPNQGCLSLREGGCQLGEQDLAEARGEGRGKEGVGPPMGWRRGLGFLGCLGICGRLRTRVSRPAESIVWTIGRSVPRRQDQAWTVRSGLKVASERNYKGARGEWERRWSSWHSRGCHGLVLVLAMWGKRIFAGALAACA